MTHPYGELRERLLDLAEPSQLPPDLFDRVQSRARRTRLRRVGTGALAAASVTAVAAAVLALPGVLAGPSGPTTAQLSSLIAAGDAPARPYHGPGIPAQLQRTKLWLIEEHYAAPQHTVIVSYETDGHPCLGEIDWSPVPATKLTGSGFEGDCSDTTRLEALGSYGPLGPPRMVGTEAYLYGTVSRAVRVVRADVKSGHLAERFAATIATPADSQERFFVFHAPGGTEHGIKVVLTFYDSNGSTIGSRHINDSFNDHPDMDCASPTTHGARCAIATANTSLSATDIASSAVQAVFPAGDVTQAEAATRACGATDGFVFKTGSFAGKLQVLVTHPDPWRVASARAIGACLQRQPGVIRVTGVAMRPTPTPCASGYICPASPSARRS